MTLLQLLAGRLREAILLEPARPDPDRIGSIVATLGADGCWPDVDYDNELIANDWSPTIHLNRMRELAVAYAHGDPVIAEPLLRALGGWLDANPVSQNWWHNQIGAPMGLGDTLLLAEPVLSGDQRRRGAERLGNQQWDNKTAQNLIWVAEVALRYAVMAQDEEVAADAFRRIRNDVRIVSGEGVQRDRSFHQHDAQLYFGGYGHEFALSTARLAYIGDGTPFGFHPDQVEIIRSYLLDGLRYAIHRGHYDFTAMGRCLTRPDAQHDAAALTTSLAYLDRLSSERSADIAEFRSALEGSPRLVASRYFWRSDYFSHHRPTWSASVKMASTHTVPTESGNGEGLRSWYLGEGVSPLWTTGEEYLDIFPVWDWRRLPGSTIEQQHGELPIARWQLTPDGRPFRGQRAHVGGLSHGSYGFCVMRVAKDNLEDGFKAWFFADQEVVALGAGLKASAATSPVWTTVAQVVRSGPVTYADSSGIKTLHHGTAVTLTGARWVHHGNVTYAFCEPTDNVRVSSITNIGSWQDVSSVQSAEPLSRDVVTMAIDHGRRPVDGGYRYLLLPATEVPTEPDHGQAIVIANQPELQAVWHPVEGLAQLAFHRAGRCIVPDGPSVEVDRPLLVQLSRQDPGRVAIADPLRRGGELRLTLNGEQTRTLVLPDGDEAGRTMFVEP